MRSELIPSADERLNAQIDFTIEIDRMTSVLRRNLVTDGSRNENDAEHSWHIAVMALYFSEYCVEKPDVSHSAEMLIVHDLIEIYAGDTFAYDVEGQKGKADRERLAADRLYAILPEDQGARLRSLWEEFEECATPESKYANCLDRIQPFIHNMLTRGHTWRTPQTRPVRAQVEKRNDVVREFMPEVYDWLMKNMDAAVERGWLLEG